MIILSYFDRIIGPKVFLTNPTNLIKELNNEYTNQIKSLFESSNINRFFTHYFPPELNTANFIFSIASGWARGREEVVMISIIISEEEPDYFVYEKMLTKFVEKLIEIPDMFKAFYIDSGPEEEKGEIQKKFTNLREEMVNLYKILLIKKVETEGQLLSFSKLKDQKVIELSNSMIKKIGDLTGEDQNCFFVFRTQGKAMKIDVIPVEADKIFNLILIFGEQMTIKILHEISKIFAKYENSISLIFTSGICAEIDRCIYEVWVVVNQPEEETLNLIINDIYKISGVLEIEVKLVETKN